MDQDYATVGQLWDGHLGWVNALRPDVGPRWQQRDYHVIEVESAWREATAVTATDVLAALRRAGIDLPHGTLRRWAATDLIPRPYRYSTDRPGRYADWPDETPGEAGAAWALLRGQTALPGARWPIDQVRRARDVARRIMAGATWDALAAEGVTWGEFMGAQQWLLVRARVLSGRRYDEPIQLTIRPGSVVVEPSTVDVVTWSGQE